MHRVPPLVAQRAGARSRPSWRRRRRSSAVPISRSDHPRVDAAAEHRRDLAADRDAGPSARSPRREKTTCATTRPEAGEAVPAVPDRQPVEADEPLERRAAAPAGSPGSARGTRQQPRDPRDARQRLPGRLHRDVAAVAPTARRSPRRSRARSPRRRPDPPSAGGVPAHRYACAPACRPRRTARKPAGARSPGPLQQR